MRSEWFLHLIFGVQFPFQKKKNVTKCQQKKEKRKHSILFIDIG